MCRHPHLEGKLNQQDRHPLLEGHVQLPHLEGCLLHPQLKGQQARYLLEVWPLAPPRLALHLGRQTLRRMASTLRWPSSAKLLEELPSFFLVAAG